MEPESTTRVGSYVIDKKGSGRQFRSDFFEAFSKCHGLTPLFVYIPIILVCLWFSRHLAPGRIVLLVLIGLFIWTLAEYWLHRLVFHWEGSKAFHYFVHGIHHEYPNDRGRMVMPPGASAVPALMFWGLMWLIAGFENALPLYAGFGAGYLWYDMTHFWTHVGKPRTSWGRRLRRHHMLHHFKDHGQRFGVSTPLWDHVFGTAGDNSAQSSNSRD